MGKGIDMVNWIRVVLLALGCSLASIGFASPQLAQSKNCMACHAVDQKKVGPSYREVAEKYTGQKDAEALLAKKIQEGSVGVWGPVPMPANVNVSAQEAKALAKWILKAK
jgi:cytochrome c